MMANGVRRPTRRTVLRAALALPGMLSLRQALADTAVPDDPEVCVIGSGPAGAVLAEALVERGVRTLLVESGPPLSAPPDSRVAALDAYESAGALTYPLATTRFRGWGGTSNLWTGSCPRLQPEDFEPNPCTPVGAPWPIRYADLDSYYAAAEAALLVRGVDGLPGAPPRGTPFPRPMDGRIPNLGRLADQATIDLALQVQPWSDDRGRPLNVAQRQLPDFAASPHATSLTGVTARRLQSDGDGRVDGLLVQSLGLPPRRLRARYYVVACGGIESARLLLLSRSTARPNGLGNHADLVGRHFMEHPVVVMARGTFEGDWDRGSAIERAATEQFTAAARRRGLGAIRLRMHARPAALENLGPPWESLRNAVAAQRRLVVDVKGDIEMAPAADNRVTLAAGRRDAFGDPGARLTLAFGDADRRAIDFAEAAVRRLLAGFGARDVAVRTGPLLWLHHHVGTCRMGDDPRTSVVDRDLRVHGSDNLYVAGSAPFVTSGVSNPTLTIAALSLRLADHLAGRLRC